jgi:transcriptional regulator with XRE-family HTH domain
MAAPRSRSAMVAYGRVLRRRREIKGLTIAHLANVTGITANYIGHLEQGKRNPSLCMMLRLADALEVPIAEMVGGTDDLSAEGLEAGRLMERIPVRLRDAALAILRAIATEKEEP